MGADKKFISFDKLVGCHFYSISPSVNCNKKCTYEQIQ